MKSMEPFAKPPLVRSSRVAEIEPLGLISNFLKQLGAFFVN
jgi:hypothetical protein